ncbi:MAG: hypothetical protein ACFFEV_08795, partial [Candidatus Thorarchaeota archaeon]
FKKVMEIPDLLIVKYYELATDVHPDVYLLYRNDVIIDEDTWESGVNITHWTDYLDPNLYNYTMWVNDTVGLSASCTFWIEVIDSTNPIIDNPVDVYYELGSTDNWIEWTVTEVYYDTFTVHLNISTLHSSGNYITDIIFPYEGNITINIDGLEIGIWNFTLVAYDEAGNLEVNTVLVHVVDTTSPICISNGDVEFEDSDTIPAIEWTCFDLDPYEWYLYKNKTEYATDFWDGSNLQFNLDDVGVGFWNWTLVIVDGSGNSASDILWMTIVDTTNPLVNSPSDIKFEFGTTAHIIVWAPNDLNPESYIIWIDDSVYHQGDWNTSLDIIIINVDDLPVGEYNYTIKIWDTSGNWAVDTVIVTVEQALITMNGNAMIVALSVAVGVAVGAILVVVYFVKIKKV